MQRTMNRPTARVTMNVLAVTGAALALAHTATAQDMRLMGVVRDFRSTHADFGAAAATGHVAGSLSEQLNSRGNPSFAGTGREVVAQWQNADGATVMPESEVGGSGEAITDFSVDDGAIVSSQRFAAQVKVIGAAIQNYAYHLPVTVKFHIGDQAFEPFGDYSTPVESNLNDNQDVTGWSNTNLNPQTFTFPNTFDAGTAISITGKSWLKNRWSNSGRSNDHWSVCREVASHSAGSSMFALRNGDSVPSMAGAYNQASAAEYLADYVDGDGNVVLEDHQTIYLFELANGYDYQDLVVLVSLATDTSFFETTPSSDPAPTCVSDVTVAGEFGDESDGGVSSASSFAQWFADNPGHNFSMRHTIALAQNDQGFWEYDTADFTPVDGEGFGNEGAPHNRNFTYEIDATFTYDACAGQMIEFEGSDDFWVFVNDELAMDLGGTEAGTSQTLEVDRLGLTDGETYSLKLFYAHRASASAPFRLRSNIMMHTTRDIITTSSGLFD